MKYNKIFAALLSLSFIGATSCSDEWDDHYAVQSNGEGTIWEVISNTPELSNFASVLKTTHYDTDLSESQVFTVFAPTNDKFTEDDAKELIDEYNTEIAKYGNNSLKRSKTSTVKEFVQNHISLYNHSVSSATDTTITMLNGKVLPFNSSSFSGISYIQKNIPTGNGVLYTLDGEAKYSFNIFEYIKKDQRLDSVASFFYMSKPYQYYIEQFKASESVPGEIVNGQQEYLDSVVEAHNVILEDLMGAILSDEDSTYRVVLPTNEEFAKQITRYNELFQYPIGTDKRDSLMFYYPHYLLLNGTCFSKTRNPNMYNTSVDSVANTIAKPYLLRKLYYDSYSVRKHIFMNPYSSGGIFEGITPVKCSNGDILVSDDWRIKLNQTFLNSIVREAETTYDVVDSVSGYPTASKASWTRVEVTNDSPYYNQVSNNEFCVLATKTASLTPFVQLAIPNIMSNVEYELHVTTVPAAAAYGTDTLNVTTEDLLPGKFVTTLYWKDLDGNVQHEMLKTSDIDKNGLVYSTAGSEIKRDGLYYVANIDASKIHDINLGTIKLASCEYGLSVPTVWMTIQMRGSKNKFASTLRLDKITLIPVKDE